MESFYNKVRLGVILLFDEKSEKVQIFKMDFKRFVYDNLFVHHLQISSSSIQLDLVTTQTFAKFWNYFDSKFTFSFLHKLFT